MNRTINNAHQPVLWHCVKELLQINVYNPYASVIEVFQQLHNGLSTAPSRPEAIAVFTELSLKYR